MEMLRKYPAFLMELKDIPLLLLLLLLKYKNTKSISFTSRYKKIWEITSATLVLFIRILEYSAEISKGETDNSHL
jgi:hypothetical protein